MILSVATNFDDALIDRIAGKPVDEVYGKLSRDVVGGGRAGFSTGGVDRSRLETHIRKAHSRGFRFNYLLNPACMGNREWTRDGYAAIRSLLDDLAALDVDSVTVSMPFLGEIVTRHYPQFRLKVGIYANIDSPARARYWEDLGAAELVLESFSVNRDFPLLAAIRESVRCDLQLIANFACLPRCPLQISHMVGISHASTSVDTAPFVDWCIFKCSSMTLKDPSLLVRSNWIRPEDLAVYERLGYDRFKLLERNAPTDVLEQRVSAYASRTSPDDLLELIQPFGFPQEVKKEAGWFLKVLWHHPRLAFPLYKLLRLRGMLYPLRGRPLRLESAKIPADFLERRSGRPCTEGRACGSCEVCGSIARDAVRMDPAWRDECLRLYRKVFRLLCP